MGDPGGDGDIGDAHKRSNGVNGDETERPGRLSAKAGLNGATARNAVGWRGVPADTSGQTTPEPLVVALQGRERRPQAGAWWASAAVGASSLQPHLLVPAAALAHHAALRAVAPGVE